MRIRIYRVLEERLQFPNMNLHDASEDLKRFKIISLDDKNSMGSSSLLEERLSLLIKECWS